MTKENRQRPHRKMVQSLPVLLSAVFLKAEVRLSRPPQVPGRRAGFPARWIPHMENRGKPGCLQKKLFKTARYIHNACDKISRPRAASSLPPRPAGSPRFRS